MVEVITHMESKELDSKKADSPYKERQEAEEGRQKQQEDVQSEQQDTGICFALLTVCNLGNTRAC